MTEGELQPVLSRRDGRRGARRAVDAGPPARDGRRIDPLQRFAARRAADVARPSVETSQGAGDRRRDRSRPRSAGEPGVFEYRLTESGQELKPVIEAIGCWGQRWIDLEASLEKLDPNLLMWDMRRNIDPRPMPRAPQHDPGHLHRPAGDAAQLVARRRARAGGRSLLGRSRASTSISICRPTSGR